MMLLAEPTRTTGRRYNLGICNEFARVLTQDPRFRTFVSRLHESHIIRTMTPAQADE